jgi:hypothetical protein
MVIPQVRREILKLAAELHRAVGKLRELEKELYRRKGVRPTKVRSRAFTPDLSMQLRAYKRDHPELSMQQIANRFKVNSGRVTDAILGKRK